MPTGLERGEALPALSGVVADFLEKLVVLEDSSQREREDGWILARMLEMEILRGEVRESPFGNRLPRSSPISLQGARRIFR